MWTWPQLEAFLTAHGNLLILPLAVIEGPVIAVAGGFLCSRGDLDWRVVLTLLVCGDLIGDVLYYAFGRITHTSVERLGRRFRVSSEKSAQIRHRLHHDSTKLLLIGKWTHAVGAFVLIGAGMVRMPLWKFLALNLLATIPKVLLLFTVGYTLGNYARHVPHDWFAGTFLLFAVGVAAIWLLLRRRGGAPMIDVPRS